MQTSLAHGLPWPPPNHSARQKDGQFLNGHDLFLKRVGAAYHAFIDEFEKCCRCAGGHLVGRKLCILWSQLLPVCVAQAQVLESAVDTLTPHLPQDQVHGGPAVHHALRDLVAAYQEPLLAQGYAVQGAGRGGAGRDG